MLDKLFSVVEKVTFQSILIEKLADAILPNATAQASDCGPCCSGLCSGNSVAFCIGTCYGEYANTCHCHGGGSCTTSCGAGYAASCC